MDKLYSAFVFSVEIALVFMLLGVSAKWISYNVVRGIFDAKTVNATKKGVLTDGPQEN